MVIVHCCMSSYENFDFCSVTNEIIEPTKREAGPKFELILELIFLQTGKIAVD